MFKKILGISKLEKNFKVVGDSLNRSWEWINHFSKVSNVYEERIAKLERSNQQLVDITRELTNTLSQLSAPVEVAPVPEEEVIEEELPMEVEVPLPQPVMQVGDEVSLPDKDLFLVQVIYQYAAFDREHAIDTNSLFDNLTYKITSRGLRKKLESLVGGGLISSVKKGNVRYWYLNPGALGKIKKALKAKE